MTVSPIPLSPARPSPPGVRTLGTLGMIGSPLLLAYGLYALGTGATNLNGPYMGAAGLAYLGGWACSLVGARRLGALGRSFPARVALAAQFTLLLAAAAFSVQELGYGTPERIPYPILDLAWPLSHTFMFVTGAFVLRSRRWVGWRRWPALLCGFKIPLLVVASAASGGGVPPRPAQVVAFAWGALTLMLLGYAVRTGASER